MGHLVARNRSFNVLPVNDDCRLLLAILLEDTRITSPHPWTAYLVRLGVVCTDQQLG